MKAGLAAVFGLALSLGAAGALAQTQGPRTLRLSGEAPAAKDPAPRAFVIDADVKPGDSDFQTSIDGWLASTAAPASSGEVEGTCVEHRCVLTADLDDAKFILTGDFGDAAGPVGAHFTVKDPDDKTLQEGAASVRPFNGQVAGLGELAAPDALTEARMDDLLLWNHQSVSSGSPPGDDPPSSSQREALASWQQDRGRLATGLIFTADIAELHADAEAARKAAGWTPLGDAAHGWRAGYPAAILTKSSRVGPEQRFTSADGKAVLVIAVDAPMSSDDFDAFVEKVSADREGRTEVDTIRANGDLQMSFEEAGMVTVAAYHDRDNGLARVIFTYPVKAKAAYEPVETIVQHSLVVTDDLKP
ncbi:MAG TPA: hypothetical protein VHZ26_10260 [Caulobacteraceae bacterium]|jgi:hypothetical protein|nr:hypothetical protein [Caulobacteraceae bacterium]